MKTLSSKKSVYWIYLLHGTQFNRLVLVYNKIPGVAPPQLENVISRERKSAIWQNRKFPEDPYDANNPTNKAPVV